jgi:O-antigen/teichoic acid export membrane protein
MRKLVLAILLIALWLLPAAPLAAADPLRVYYAGPEGRVKTALGLAETFTLVTDPAAADVFVLNGTLPQPETIAARVQAGAGLVLIAGPDLPAAALPTLLGTPVTAEPRDEELSLTAAPAGTDPLTTDIIWNSAPQVRERSLITPLPAGWQPVAQGFEDAEPVLSGGRVGSGQVYLLTVWLETTNPQFQDWAYFNYLLYALVGRAGGQTPLSYGDYPGSPVPHAAERTVIFSLLAGMLVIAGVAFVLVRRYSRAHPEELDRLVIDREEFTARQAQTDWDEIGFHRPLGGFLFAFLLALIFFIPLIIYQNLILPSYILPSAQALGLWGRVTQFFNLFWLLLDMGTSAAFVKYLAEYRVHDPRRGVQYGQVFVWWQALSGAVQVAIVTAIASTLLPNTAYGFYAWSLIVHVAIQIPGFYMVMRHALLGMQRYDYGQVVEVAHSLLFPMLTQPIFVLLFVAWGRSHPVFGLAMGGVIGLGVAAYATEALVLVLGLWLYRRLGYNARVFFLAHFDWTIVKEAFRFGLFEMLGSVAWAVGQSVEILITQTRLVNYAEIWGNWTLAQNFIFAYNGAWTLYNNLMPSISEAISNARQALSQYYATLAYKWGALVSAFIGAILLAVADRFILGASGPEFARAARYVIPLIFWGALQYPSWVGDIVQLAANRPYLKAALVGMEQLIRIGLAYLLLARYQINALIFAYIIAIVIKDLVAYLVNHRLCFPQRFYLWQALIAPLLAGAAHYAVLRPLTGLLWRGDQLTSVLIFFIGILPSYPLFMFFYGLFGGWDQPQLDELRRAVNLSSFMRPLAWLFWAATAAGARISPLHNRFPVEIRDAALAEARSLMEERVTL